MLNILLLLYVSPLFETVSAHDVPLEGLICIDIDECKFQGVCPKTAECKNSQGSYSCNCLDGFEGNFCEDINECSSTTACHANASCLNTHGSFACSCNEGYYGTGDSCFPGRCLDDNCPQNQKCVSATTIDCECKEGFRGNSSSDCVDIDECQENDCIDKTDCLNTIGSYICREHSSTTSLAIKRRVGHGKKC